VTPFAASVELRAGTASGTVPLAPGTAPLGDLEVEVAVSDLGSGVRIDWTLHNRGRSPVAVDEVRIRRYDLRPARVLEHGYASWSVVRRCAPDDVQPGRRSHPDWMLGEHWADPSRAGRVVMGDQFLLHDGGIVGFLDGREHLSVVEAPSPRASGPGLAACALLDGIEIDPGGHRVLDPLFVGDGDPGERYTEYVGHWAAVAGAGARASTPVPFGWCSWYEHWGRPTPAAVRAALGHARRHGLGLVQIDDGYSMIGDWETPWAGWEPAGTLRALAAEIGGAGLAAGLWTAPFIAGRASELARSRPDWLAESAPGVPLTAMEHPHENWGGGAVALDTTNPEVLDHLTELYARLRSDGWTYHKTDFLYAASLPGRRLMGRTTTRAQAQRMGLGAVRAGIGDDAFLLGCGVPLAQAVGLVDAVRVSADTGPRWDPGEERPGMEATVPAARNAIVVSALRAPMHRRLWANDPDCLLLRPTATELSPAQRRSMLDAVVGLGAFAILSDDLDRYGELEWAMVDYVHDVRKAADVPVHLVDPFSEPAVEITGGPFRLVVDTGTGATSLRGV
jgi:alpha-galactosidase